LNIKMTAVLTKYARMIGRIFSFPKHRLICGKSRKGNFLPPIRVTESEPFVKLSRSLPFVQLVHNQGKGYHNDYDTNSNQYSVHFISER